MLSLAVDQYSKAEAPVMLAGTEAGLFISRSSGNWSPIDTFPASEEGAAVAVKAVAISAADIGDGSMDYHVTVGTSGGALSGSAVLDSNGVVVEELEPPEEEAPVEEEENTEENETEDSEEDSEEES